METVYTARVPALFGDAELRRGAESMISGVNFSAAVILDAVLEAIVVSDSQSNGGPWVKMVE